MRNLRSMTVEPIATYILIAINVAIFVGVQSNFRIEEQLVLTQLAYDSTGAVVCRRGRVVAAHHVGLPAHGDPGTSA